MEANLWSSVRSQRILGIARAYTTYYGDELSKEPKEGLESNNFDKRIRDMEENDNQIGQAQQPQPVSIQLPPVKEFDPKGDPSTEVNDCFAGSCFAMTDPDPNVSGPSASEGNSGTSVFISNVPLSPRISLEGNLAENWKQWKQIYGAATETNTAQARVMAGQDDNQELMANYVGKQSSPRKTIGDTRGLVSG
eukprot:gene17373-biopygen6321